LSDGDTVELRQKAKEMALVLEATQSSERDVPDYLEIDHERMRGRFIRAPKLSDVPYPVTMEPNLVVEFYSR
jgi:small subunit ribosomal protein S4